MFLVLLIFSIIIPIAARSPVFSHLSTSLYGLTTIRAFKVQAPFELTFDHYQDQHTATWFMFISVTRWFGIVLDWLCVAYITSVTVAMVILSEGKYICE